MFFLEDHLLVFTWSMSKAGEPSKTNLVVCLSGEPELPKSIGTRLLLLIGEPLNWKPLTAEPCVEEHFIVFACDCFLFKFDYNFKAEARLNKENF